MCLYGIVAVRSSRTALQDALRRESEPLLETVAPKRDESVFGARWGKAATSGEEGRNGSTVESNEEKRQFDRSLLQGTAHIDHGLIPFDDQLGPLNNFGACR